MTVVATPATPVIITTDQVRMFLRDHPDYNILIEGVQFRQDEINFAIEMVTSKYNAITPQTMIVPSSWPTHLQYVLLLGVAAFLMKMEASKQLRNQLTYQDGDIAPIGIDDKHASYVQWGQILQQEWDFITRNIKTQDNLESIYGYIRSGYSYVTRYSRQ